MIVVLDAGHGKETPGKRSPDNSLYEWEFNRSMAARVKRYLEEAGVSVILTCETTDDVTLAKRCSIANNAKANVFVSLHANANGCNWNSARGYEIYVYKKGANAEKMANSIRSKTIALCNLKDRGTKEADFYVLRKTNMPAVLIEHGFYTNREEVELLKSDNFRDKLAMADAQGILNYLGILGGSNVTTNQSGRNSEYTLKNGIHILKVPAKDFRVQYWDKPKKTAAIKNYANGGYFGNYKEAGHFFTLPLGNLACDYYSNVAPIAQDYLKKMGAISGNKLRISNGKHKMSTLFVYKNDIAQIEATTFTPIDAKYAISGAPVIIKGKDASWSKDVLSQGFDGSIARPTWHGFLGLKGDGFIYYMGMQTNTKNLWNSSEAYKAFKAMGFVDVIKIDGGGSYILDVDGNNKAATNENRQVNTVVRFL